MDVIRPTYLISTGPNVSVGTSYDTVDVLRPMLVVATSYDSYQLTDPCLVVPTSYDSYQAELGEAARLQARLGGRATLLLLCTCVVVCCDLPAGPAITDQGARGSKAKLLCKHFGCKAALLLGEH